MNAMTRDELLEALKNPEKNFPELVSAIKRADQVDVQLDPNDPNALIITRSVPQIEQLLCATFRTGQKTG